MLFHCETAPPVRASQCELLNSPFVREGSAEGIVSGFVPLRAHLDPRRTPRLTASRSSDPPSPLGVSRIIGRAPESGVVDEEAERLEAEVAHPRSRRGDRPGCPAAFWLSFRCRTRTLARPTARSSAPIVSWYSEGGPQGIPRGEKMAGVDADAQPFGGLDQLEEPARGARTGGPGTTPGRRSSPGRSSAPRPGSGGGPRRAPGRSGSGRPPRPSRRGRPGGSPGRRSPGPRRARLPAVSDAIDFSQRASSGLPRLIR